MGNPPYSTEACYCHCLSTLPLQPVTLKEKTLVLLISRERHGPNSHLATGSRTFQKGYPWELCSCYVEPLSWLVIIRPRAPLMVSRLFENWPEGMAHSPCSVLALMRSCHVFFKGFCSSNSPHAGTCWVKYVSSLEHPTWGWENLWLHFMFRWCVSISECPSQVQVPTESPGEGPSAQQTSCEILVTASRDFFFLMWLMSGFGEERWWVFFFFPYLGPIKVLIWEWWASVFQFQSKL